MSCSKQIYGSMIRIFVFISVDQFNLRQLRSHSHFGR